MVAAGMIAGKVALVTGAASGLGEAIARRFVEEGCQVVIGDIDVDAGTALAAALGAPASFLKLDVAQEADWRAAMAAIERLHGRLDILVNNAGIATYGSVETLDIADFRALLDIDLVGVLAGCKYVIPLMRQTGGSVINMSSMASVRADAGLAGYNAAKAGVTMLTKSAALHYAKSGYGIRCNSIHPGVIHTPILDKVMAQVPEPQAMYDGWVSRHPIGRIGRPEEVAEIALFLASERSGFATGAEFFVDGGSSL